MNRSVALVLVAAVVTVGCSRRKNTTTTLPVPTVRKIPLSPPPKRAQVPPKKTQPPASTPSPPPADAVAPAPASGPPSLQAISTPEERQERMRIIAESISRARANVNVLKTRGSAASQAQEIGRVESFLRQAENARQEKQLGTAWDYARRAEVLSDDLLRR